MASQHSDPLVGQQVGRYTIQSVLGRGGMGVVYKAYDTGLDRTVAIKTITAHLAEDSQFIRRFWTEAKAMAKLETPHIVNVYDVEETPHGLWILMEYVEGKSLGERIKTGGPLSWKEALPLIEQTLQGFRYAHERGVLHRDVKPSNVMVTPRGMVKIMDFGLAKVHSGESTMTVGTGGTLYYMAPEQVKGLSHVDARSDLYSWGMSCYEMLTGDIPFDKSESQFSIMNAIINGAYHKPLDFPADVPVGLQALIKKALALDPDDRFQSAEEMLEALAAFVRGKGSGESVRVSTVVPEAPVPAADKKPQPASEPSSASDKKNRKPLVGAVIALVVVLGGAWWLWGDTLLMYLNSDMADHNRLITTEPPGARVMVNGVWIGESPVEVPLDLVDFSDQVMMVHVQHEAYRNISTRTAARSLPLHFALEPSGRLNLNIAPPDAQVLLDGEPLERTRWSDVEVTVGSHQLTVSQPGFETVERMVEVQQGIMHPVEVRLPPVERGRNPVIEGLLTPGQQPPPPPNQAPGTLEIIVRPWGDIYIDGTLQREGWDRLFSIQLRPGTHIVRLVHPQLGTFDQVVTLTSGETVRLDKDMNDL